MDLNNKVNSTDTNAAAFAKGNNKSSVFNDGIDNRFNAHEELKKSFIDPDVDEPEPETIISINDSPVASKQNISVIIGAAKAGKTFLCLLVLAAINGASIDGLGVMEGSKAAYFDTEQARPHIRRMINFPP